MFIVMSFKNVAYFVMCQKIISMCSAHQHKWNVSSENTLILVSMGRDICIKQSKQNISRTI